MGVGCTKCARVIESCSLKEKKKTKREVQRNAINVTVVWFYLGNGVIH